MRRKLAARDGRRCWYCNFEDLLLNDKELDAVAPLVWEPDRFEEVIDYAAWEQDMPVAPTRLMNFGGYWRVADGWHTAHIEHYLPVTAGGTDDLENLVLACASCNRAKGSTVLALPKDEVRGTDPFGVAARRARPAAAA